MTKKQSSYTDQTQPPYFRLDQSQRETYQEAAVAFLTDRRFLDNFTSVGRIERATWERSRRQSELPDSTAASPASVQNANWPSQTIGPVRNLYYRRLFANRTPTEGTIPIWDFPSYLHYKQAKVRLVIRFDEPLPRPVVHLGGGFPADVHASEWLLHDFFLNDVLTALGLTWKEVELGIADAFRGALPKRFQKLLAADDPYGFVLWKRELERWWYFSRHGEGIIAHTQGLRRAVAKTPYTHQFEGVFRHLESLVTPADWTRTVTTKDGKNALPKFLGDESPIIKTVNKALDAVVWNGIKYQQVPPPMPAFARHICDQKTDAKNFNGERPAEYWMLLADILYHLPLIRGLPALRRRLNETPRILPAQSANAVRLSATRPPRDGDGKNKATPDKPADTKPIV